MFQTLKLKTVNLIVTALLVCTGVVVVGSAVFTLQKIALVQVAWQNFQLNRSEEVRVERALRASIGYGGMIHEFKNYILRKDLHLAKRVQAKLGAAQAIIGQYQTLELSNAKQVALADISEVLKAYGEGVDIVTTLIKQGESSQVIDQTVRVDDIPAIRGFSALASGVEGVERMITSGQITKGQLAAELREALGYGGLIHHYKNYILRGDHEQLDLFVSSQERAKTIIEHYRNTGATKLELMALDDIDGVICQYRENTQQIINLLKAGKAIEEIDQQVKVPDSKALRGLLILDQEIMAQVAKRDRAVSSTLQNVYNLVKMSSWFSVLLLLFVTIFLAWLMFAVVIRPVIGLTSVMRELSLDRFVGTISNSGRNNEIGQMTKAVVVFQKNAIRRQEAEDQLVEANEHLNQQLHDIGVLREQADRQAHDALSLANHLVSAQEATTKALTLAENGEKRVNSILETMIDAMIIIDRRGIIEHFNPSAEKMFGYKDHVVIGQNISLLMPEPNRSQHDKYMEEYFRGLSKREWGKSMEQTALRQDGSTFPVEISLGVMTIDGEVKFTGIARDISDRKAAEDEIRRLALTDPLTGLANRNQFNTSLEDAFNRAIRFDLHIALMMIDLDKFKAVNDTYGHPVGDAVLKWAADSIVDSVRKVDTVARLGGDEFAVVLIYNKDTADVAIPAAKIISKISTSVVLAGQQIQIGASIGISYLDNDDKSTEELLSEADKALYQAKNEGRNRFKIYQAPSVG